MNGNKIKLVFFDMEGTLFKKTKFKVNGKVASSAWPAVGSSLGEEALESERKNCDKWNEGRYKSYLQWVEDTLEIYKKYNLTKEQFEGVLKQIDYHQGVFEVFEELNKRGIVTALISGGFKAQADRAQMDLKLHHCFAACEIFWNKDGSINHWNSLPCDYEGKADFMKLLISEYKLKPEECAFVGDGVNDVHLAQAVGVSISFNGAEDLEKVCNYQIRQDEGEEDFKEVLKYLDLS